METLAPQQYHKLVPGEPAAAAAQLKSSAEGVPVTAK
jgi:hypothetical protein